MNLIYFSLPATLIIPGGEKNKNMVGVMKSQFKNVRNELL